MRVFEPLTIGNLELRNRIVRTAHGVPLRWVDDADDQIRYHGARAKGGVALSIMGIAGVHPTGPTNIPILTDACIPGYQRLAEAMHSDGMKLMQQLWHGGAVKPNALGGAPWGPSAVPSPTLGLVPQSMTKGMIDDMVQAFADGARRCQAGGLDGVEIHAAHGYLITQFLSGATNRREDEYGGSFENRMRFLREIIAAVRSEVGHDFVVGVRLTSNEFVEGGIDAEECARMATAVEHDVEFLDISCGGYFRPYKFVAPMDDPLGYELEHSTVATKAVSAVPTIVTGRVMTLDHANHIVESGLADMVSIVRALIADPEIVTKTVQGRTAEIRPCIGSSQGCVGGTMSGNFHCVVNPSASRETPGFEPVATPKRVLVAGGGPAGMEAARAAALRGHQVTLVEMKRFLGGQVPIAAKAPHRADFEAITRWQAEELQRVGVDVLLRTPVDRDLVDELAPDVVIVATGSEPRTDGIQLARPTTPLPGADLPHVHTSWDVLGMGGRVQVGATALVYDENGHYEPLAAADALVAAGVRVTYVTHFDALGVKIPARDHIITPVLDRLGAAGMRLITTAHLGVVRPGQVDVQRGPVVETVEADTVVLVGVNEPNDHLLAELAGFPGEVRVIGDATGTQTLAQAIHGGDAVGRAI